MQCSSCGATIKAGMSFCNLCGNKLQSSRTDHPNQLRFETLIFAILALFVFGIAATTLLISAMKNLGFNEGLINAFVVLIFSMMLAMEGAFFWLLFSRLKESRKSTEQQKSQITNELNPAQARSLSEPASVIEYTTHKLEPVLRQPNIKD